MLCSSHASLHAWCESRRAWSMFCGLFSFFPPYVGNNLGRAYKQGYNQLSSQTIQKILCSFNNICSDAGPPLSRPIKPIESGRLLYCIYLLWVYDLGSTHNVLDTDSIGKNPQHGNLLRKDQITSLSSTVTLHTLKQSHFQGPQWIKGQTHPVWPVFHLSPHGQTGAWETWGVPGLHSNISAKNPHQGRTFTLRISAASYVWYGQSELCLGFFFFGTSPKIQLK